MTPQARAERAAAVMWAQDKASQALDMTLVSVGPGTATLNMPVRDDMLNGHGICHGGYIFTLADSAFAFACNSYNQLTVAQSNQITYCTPAHRGNMLTAFAEEVTREGRSGCYDVRVTNADGTLIAVFRGLSRSIKGHHFEEDV